MSAEPDQARCPDCGLCAGDIPGSPKTHEVLSSGTWLGRRPSHPILKAKAEWAAAPASGASTAPKDPGTQGMSATEGATGLKRAPEIRTHGVRDLEPKNMCRRGREGREEGGRGSGGENRQEGGKGESERWGARGTQGENGERGARLGAAGPTSGASLLAPPGRAPGRQSGLQEAGGRGRQWRGGVRNLGLNLALPLQGAGRARSSRCKGDTK